MEPGTLELQVFVSLIVILGTAFVALVCDYLKGSNEHLREHNIELRVRKEEQERHRPVEAVEWLQHLMGARQGSGIRFGGTRSARKPQPGAHAAKAAAEAPAGEARRPATHRREPTHAGTRPEPAHAEPSPVRRTAAPAAAAAADPSNPMTAKPPVSPVSEPRFTAPPVAAPTSVATAVGVVTEDRPRTSRVMEARARREATGTLGDNSILENLPLPGWLKKERESSERLTATRSVADTPAVRPVPVPFQVEEPVVAEAPVAVAASVPVADTPQVAEVAGKKPSVWTYRGLLDQVVAATGDRKPAESVTPESVTEFAALTEEKLVETVLEGQGKSSPQFVTVAVEMPSEPMHDSSETLSTVEHPSAPVAMPEVTAEEPVGVPPVLLVEETHVSHDLFWLPETTPAPAVIAAEAEQETAFSFEANPTELKFTDASVADVADVPQAQSEHAEIEQPTDLDIAEVVEMSPVSPLNQLVVPAGFHDRSVLDGLLKTTEVISGVVVAIGINDYALHSEKMGRSGMQQWMDSVESMIRSLLLEKDFGCRSSEDEFVLVFPDETGAAAQKRLNTISERLWSFQLRSLGAFSVMFSWGAVEIQGETLADAAASASERMYQTKRNRKTISMDTAGRPRKAVNL